MLLLQSISVSCKCKFIFLLFYWYSTEVTRLFVAIHEYQNFRERNFSCSFIRFGFIRFMVLLIISFTNLTISIEINSSNVRKNRLEDAAHHIHGGLVLHTTNCQMEKYGQPISDAQQSQVSGFNMSG